MNGATWASRGLRSPRSVEKVCTAPSTGYCAALPLCTREEADEGRLWAWGNEQESLMFQRYRTQGAAWAARPRRWGPSCSHAAPSDVNKERAVKWGDGVPVSSENRTSKDRDPSRVRGRKATRQEWESHWRAAVTPKPTPPQLLKVCIWRCPLRPWYYCSPCQRLALQSFAWCHS